MTNLKAQIHNNPMSWKDWVAVGAFVFTIGGALLQGGRIIATQEEQVRATQALVQRTEAIQADITGVTTAVTRLEGRSQLHDEQIRVMSNDIDRLRGHAK